jgi:hypothetical protein
MSSEPLHIFDPRRNFQTQGFTGKGATTTMYDATETRVSISGIFQAPDDFAVLGWWNAYDYFNHLRCKHLPRTDLSGLKLEIDIEYDHALDGAIRLDAAKYCSIRIAQLLASPLRLCELSFARSESCPANRAHWTQTPDTST